MSEQNNNDAELIKVEELEKLIPEMAGTSAKKARKTGYIDIDALSYVLAIDDNCTESLGYLWEQFHLYKRNAATPKVDREASRAEAWHKILHRLAFGTVSGVQDEIVDGYRYIKIFRFNKDIGDFEPSTAQAYLERVGHGAAFISLEEIKTYFTQILEIPLPSMLFSEPQSEKIKDRGLGPAKAADKLRKTELAPENEEQFLIKFPGKSSRPCTYADLGCRSQYTKEFRYLLEVIKNGSIYLREQPSKKTFKRACKKLVDHINQTYPGFLPEECTIHEKISDNNYRLTLKIKRNFDFDPASNGEDKKSFLQDLRRNVDVLNRLEENDEQKIKEIREVISDLYFKAHDAGASKQELEAAVQSSDDSVQRLLKEETEGQYNPSTSYFQDDLRSKSKPS